MKVTLDLDLCDAHGDCVLAAPAVFDLGDDDETATVLLPEPGEEHRAAVDLAAKNCPVAAITVEG